MATQVKPEMRTEPCVICGKPNTRPKCAFMNWCPECFRILLCVRNKIPVEITPAVQAALNEQMARM